MATGLAVFKNPSKQEVSCKSLSFIEHKNIKLTAIAFLLGEKSLQFECKICSSNFTNADEQDSHIMGHFNQKYCTACEKLLIQFGSRWYEVKLHIDAECQTTDTLEHNLDFQIESMKIEQIDLEPTEIPAELDEIYNEDNCLSTSDSVSDDRSNEFKIDEMRKKPEKTSAETKPVRRGKHRKRKAGSGLKTHQYICDYCEDMFYSKKDILKHIRRTHSNQQNYFVCNICGKSFNDKSNLFIHRTAHNDASDIRCYICSETFKDRIELKTHRTNVHVSVFLENSDFVCELCNKSFKLEIALGNHKKKVHKLNNPYKCTECNEVFPNKNTLNAHCSTHLNKSLYACKLCDKKFQHKPTLITHMNRIHAGFRPNRFNCDKCEKNFGRKFELINHRLVVHEGKKLFECETCSKNCLNKQALKTHKRSHLPTKLFVCDICGEGFNTEHILNRHIKTHSGMRPYPCAQCDKAFTRPEHLKRHSRIHTGERLYHCDVGDCNRSYVNAADLEQHKCTVHGIQFKRDGFICSVCSKPYVQKSLLKKHMQSHI